MPVNEIVLAGIAAALSIAVILACSWYVFLIARKPLHFGEQSVRIGLSVFRIEFPYRSLNLDAARVVNIANDDVYRPAVRLSDGYSFPSIEVGWFRLANDDQAYVHLWGGAPAIYIPVNDGKVLLLETNDPEGVLSRIKENVDSF